MAVEIIEETIDRPKEYEKVSIAFQVSSYLRAEWIQGGLGGVTFTEESVVPYRKDYDVNEDDRASQWPRHWDVSAWGILTALADGQRVGGAAIAWKTPGLCLLENGDHLACLWDLRVHPAYRKIGYRLFTHALDWARARGCRRLVVETQNINVPACRFYARQGRTLGGVNCYAYADHPDEIQLLWYRNL